MHVLLLCSRVCSVVRGYSSSMSHAFFHGRNNHIRVIGVRSYGTWPFLRGAGAHGSIAHITHGGEPSSQQWAQNYGSILYISTADPTRFDVWATPMGLTNLHLPLESGYLLANDVQVDPYFAIRAGLPCQLMDVYRERLPTTEDYVDIYMHSWLDPPKLWSLYRGFGTKDPLDWYKVYKCQFQMHCIFENDNVPMHMAETAHRLPYAWPLTSVPVELSRI